MTIRSIPMPGELVAGVLAVRPLNFAQNTGSGVSHATPPAGMAHESIAHPTSSIGMTHQAQTAAGASREIIRYRGGDR